MKKKRAGFISIIMILMLLFAGLYPVTKAFGVQAAEKKTIANVVIFVDFQDTDHSTHGSTDCFLNEEKTFEYFNGNSATVYSMKQYLSTISYGYLDVENIFPQYDEATGDITPYLLDYDASYYASDKDSRLISEIIQKLNAAGGIDGDADLDDDGCIDNFTIVVPCDNGKENKLYNGRKSEYGGTTTVGGLRLIDYNLITESGVYCGTQQAGLIIHEFLHTLGYPDLYRVGSTGGNEMPVGMWDIMAKNLKYLQYPLAYFRSEVSGWFNIPVVTESVKDYSIYAASATTEKTKDNQAVILKTPYSETEFFVVEYRHANERYSKNEYDSWTYGDGLIIYRVNTSCESNAAGSTDMVYVFRPGDTVTSGYEDGFGEISESFLSAESERTSYGSADASATLSDGAITYSDGTNSGIVISSVGSASGDTISFDITYNDLTSSNGGYWSSSSVDISDTMYGMDACMDASGNIYALKTTASSLSLYKYSIASGKWSREGADINAGNVYAGITYYKGDIYVGFSNASNGYYGELYRLNKASWQKVYTTSVPVGGFSINAGDDGVYMAYVNYSATYTESNKLLYGAVYNGSSATLLGDKICTGSYLADPNIAYEGGTLMVGCRDAFGGNRVYIKKYDKTAKTWSDMGTYTVANFKLCINNGKLYLMQNGDGLGSYDSNVLTMDKDTSSGSWTLLGNSNFESKSLNERDFCFNGDVPYVVYQYGSDTDTSSGIYVKNLVDNKWTLLGTRLSGETSQGLRAFTYDNTVYVVYAANETGKLYVKWHKVLDKDTVENQPATTETPTTEQPVTTEKPTVTTEQPVTTEKPTVTTEQPVTTEKPAVTTEQPVTTEKPTVTTEQPVTTEKPAVTTEKPAVTTEKPTVTTTTAAATVPSVMVSYRTHVQSFGWQDYVANGAMSGTSGRSKRLEAINIKVSGNSNLGIQYTTHCQSYGWLPWSANGDMSGTEGESKRLEAIKIQLTGADKDKYDVYYRVHAQSYGWLGWAKNGAAAGTAGYSKRLEGIQIVVVKKGETFNRKVGNVSSVRSEAYIAKSGTSPVVGGAVTSAANPEIGGASTPNVTYRTHVQSYGWQGWKYNGQMSGTSGEAKRLEGIQIRLTNCPYSGGITYQTHIQSYGWSKGWSSNGEMAGTSGESKRLEAIEIKLTGEMANHYDVYYRVHAQSYGWLGWAKNGESAGTAGHSKRLEGIQIVLVPKGSSAPSDSYGGIKSARTACFIDRR